MQKIIALLCVIFLFGCNANQSVKHSLPDGQTQAPTHGGMLKIHSYNFDTLNPLYTKSKTNRQVLMLIYDFLIVCDNKQAPEMVLASDFFLSNDAFIWTINIKKGVLWHDGTYLTANDVAATLDAVKNSSFDSPYKENLNNVKNVEALFDSVIITLETPQTNFINLLEIPIVKAEHAPQKDIKKPIGTGCYIYAERTHKIIYLTSNKADVRQPYIENINVYLLPDKRTSVYAFEAKEIDIAQTDMEGRGDFSGYAQSKAVELNSGGYNFLAFNDKNKYLSSFEIRKAIAHAINKKQIFEEALLSQGTICDSFIHPDWQLYNKDITRYEHNPSFASDILTGQGIAPGEINLSVLVNEESNLKVNTAKIIAQQLKTAGINAGVKTEGWDSFKWNVANGNYDMYLGEINFSNDINPICIVPQAEPFITLMQRLQTQTTKEGRKNLYDAIQQEYAKLLPSIPLYFSVESVLINNKIKGEIQPFRNNIFYNIYDWYIETDNNF